METIQEKTAKQIGLCAGMEIFADSPGVVKATVTRVARNWRWCDVCWTFKDGSTYGFRWPLYWRGKTLRFEV